MNKIQNNMCICQQYVKVELDNIIVKKGKIKKINNKTLADDLTTIYENKCYLNCPEKNTLINKINETIVAHLRGFFDSESKKNVIKFILNTIKDNCNTFLLEIVNKKLFFSFISNLSAENLANKSCLEMLLLCKYDNKKICDTYIHLKYNITVDIYDLEEDSDQGGEGYEHTINFQNCYVLRKQIKEIYEYLKKTNYTLANTQIFWLMIVNHEDINDIISSFQLKINLDLLEEIVDPYVLLGNNLIDIIGDDNITYAIFKETGAMTLSLINVLQTFFDNKIIPSDKFVDNLTLLLCCMNFDELISDKIKKIQDGAKGYYCDNIDVTKYYNLLRMYGYEITFDQLCLLACNNLFITNTDDYQLNLNQQKLINIVSETKSNFYADKFELTTALVQEKCKERMSVTEVKKYVKHLDSKCLTNAIEKNTTGVIKYIVEKGGVPVTVECLKEAIYKKVLRNIQIYLVDKLYEQEQNQLHPVTVKDKEITKKPKKQVAKITVSDKPKVASIKVLKKADDEIIYDELDKQVEIKPKKKKTAKKVVDEINDL